MAKGCGAKMIDRTDENPEAWGGRPGARGGARGPGTNGAQGGTSGDRAQLPFWRSHPQVTVWIVVCALLALAGFVNVSTELDDARQQHLVLPLWRPAIEEATSVVTLLIGSVGVHAAIRKLSARRRPFWQVGVLAALGSLAFSGVHIALMTLLRVLAFPAFGQVYAWSQTDVAYEYRKDLLSYVLMVIVMWALRPQPRATPAPSARPRRTFFDIRDGATLIRVAAADIAAAHAAGNYVEFVLVDGRRPLMRASLANVERDLAELGFVRTHRSWLVNTASVRALTRAGSGDFRVDLDCGVTAPVSRRYPAALAQLRGAG